MQSRCRSPVVNIRGECAVFCCSWFKSIVSQYSVITSLQIIVFTVIGCCRTINFRINFVINCNRLGMVNIITACVASSPVNIGCPDIKSSSTWRPPSIYRRWCITIVSKSWSSNSNICSHTTASISIYRNIRRPRWRWIFIVVNSYGIRAASTCIPTAVVGCPCYSMRSNCKRMTC